MSSALRLCIQSTRLAVSLQTQNALDVLSIQRGQDEHERGCREDHHHDWRGNSSGATLQCHAYRVGELLTQFV